MRNTFIVLAIVIVLAVSSIAIPHISLGATILTTNSSDTLTTFRTNVNTSLTNLNAGFTGWPFTIGLTTYSTTTQATTTPLWVQGGLFASSTATIPALAVTQSGAGPSAIFIGGSVGISTANPT